MLRSLGLVVAVAAACAGPASAGSDDIVKALRATPATLFDLTLARLESLLWVDAHTNGYSAFANYQDGEIMIWAYSLEAPSTDEACKAMLDRIKRLAAVDPETGFPDDPASRFAGLFNYPHLRASDIDMTYDETVDAMFHLRGVIGISGDGKAVICDTLLLSKDTSFGRD